MSKDSFYFTHDSNARHDPKIKGLISEFGISGYGAFWIIIEMLREAEGYKLPKKKYVFSTIKSEINDSKITDCEKFIKTLENEYELLQSDNNYFWSPSLDRRMKKMDEKRIQASNAGKKSAQKRGIKIQQTLNDSSTIKENNMKEHDNKQNNNYIPNNFDYFLNELIQVFNQVFENVHPFGNISSITEKRKIKIFEAQKKTLKTLTDWEDYFKHIKKFTHVSFYDWACFDSIISEGYMAQIREGKHDRYRRQASGLYYRYNEHGEKDGNTKYRFENGEFVRD